MAATSYRIEGSPMAATAGRRRRWLVWLGALLIVAGLVGAIALWVAASSRFDDAVTRLARAPVGCDTTLDFSETGEFLLFVETRGELTDVRGDCDESGAFEYGDDDPPSVVVSMVDPDGEAVALPVQSGVDYDTEGFVGTSGWVADITTTGDHVVRVESADSSFAIAVGRDPHDGVTTLRAGAIAAAVVGLIAGLACIAGGWRRRPAPTSPAPWPPAPGGPPGWPQPYSGPPGGFPTRPPTVPPEGWPARPPIVGVPGQPPLHPPVGPPPAPGDGTRDDGTPGRDGSSGDGDRSPWAPPGTA